MEARSTKKWLERNLFRESIFGGKVVRHTFDNPIIKSAPFGIVGVVVRRGVVNKVVQLLREYFSLSKPQKIPSVYGIHRNSDQFLLQILHDPMQNPPNIIQYIIYRKAQILLRINPKRKIRPLHCLGGQGSIITSPRFFFATNQQKILQLTDPPTPTLYAPCTKHIFT